MPPHFPPTHAPVHLLLEDRLPFLLCLLVNVFDRCRLFLLRGGCLDDCMGDLIMFAFVTLLQLIMA